MRLLDVGCGWGVMLVHAFDAISSIGMFEHVGLAKMRPYLGNLTAMQELGFEVRDIESLRVAFAGLPRAKIWRLYMAGAAPAFEGGRINVHQVLAVRPDPLGSSGMPLTRKELLRI